MVLTALAVVAGVLAAATVGAGAAMAAPPAGAGTTGAARRDLQPVAQPGVAGQLVTDLSTGTTQANMAEIIQRAAPTSCCSTSSTTSRATARPTCSATTTSSVPEGRPPGRLPVRVRRTVEHRHPERLRPQQQRHRRRRRRRLRLRRLPGPVRHGRALEDPIDTDEVRTFQHFLWKDMPGALLPDDPTTAAPADWYSPESSRCSGCRASRTGTSRSGRPQTVHVLASHPTPPTFDGAEDRNGRRNHDEIRFWADYVRPGAARYIYDDEGGAAGCGPGRSFVILGDQNADPLDGDSVGRDRPAARPPAHHRPAADLGRRGRGGALQGGANPTHQGDPAYDTADFDDNPRRATCAPTTCCRRAGLRSPTPPCSGRCRRPAVGADRRVPVPEQRPPARVGRRAGALSC